MGLKTHTILTCKLQAVIFSVHAVLHQGRFIVRRKHQIQTSGKKCYKFAHFDIGLA